MLNSRGSEGANTRAVILVLWCGDKIKRRQGCGFKGIVLLHLSGATILNMKFNTGTGAGLTVANHGAYAMVHPLHEAEQSGFDIADVHSVGTITFRWPICWIL